METLTFDIETDGGEPWEGSLLCVGWKYTGKPTIVEDQPTDHFLNLLATEGIPKVTQTQYDSRYFRMVGFDVAGPLHDTSVMAHVLNENQDLSLDSLVKKYLGYDPDKRLKRMAGRVMFKCDDGTWVPITEAPKDQLHAYCARDVDAEERLYRELYGLLDKYNWLDYFLDKRVPFTEVVNEMECNGLPIDLGDSEELRYELSNENEDREASLLESGGLPDGFNVGSPNQLAGYLFNRVFEFKAALDFDPDEVACIKSCVEGEHEDCGQWHLPDEELYDTHVADFLPDGFEIAHIGRTKVHGSYMVKGRGLEPTPPTEKTKRPSTDTKMLLTFHAADPWIQELTEYRKREKVLNTYLSNFPKFSYEGKLYGRFNVTGTKTGRLSSSLPNLQNIPARGELGDRVRSLFKGPLIVGDYSQLEPRLMAHFSADPTLLDIYRSNDDVYMRTANYIFGAIADKDERDICKVLMLALGYGAGEKKVAQILSVNGFPTDVPTATSYLNHLQELYFQYFRWREAVIDQAKRKGYVKTLSGRMRRLRYQFESHNWRNIGYGERQAVNAIIQGSAGDVVEWLMVDAYQRLPRLPMIGQVHDEVLWDAHGMYEEEAEEALRRIKTLGEKPAQTYSLRIPLLFEPALCFTWADKGQKLVIEVDEED